MERFRRGPAPMMPEIKRGIIQNFNPTTYTASVTLFENPSCFLTGVPVANHVDGTSGLAGAICALLFFDSQNPQDAVVIATFANEASGLPNPPPGRLTFVSGFRQINNVTITAGSIQTFTLTGFGGIPDGALAVLYKINVTSATVGAYVNLAPHGSDDTLYATAGNIVSANEHLNAGGLISLNSQGQLDIKAYTGNCTITLSTYGYVI